jgi:hypothetical protein
MMYLIKTNERKAEVVLLVFDKVDFRTNNIIINRVTS